MTTMVATGQIHKLRGVYETPIHYYWKIGDTEYFINDWIDKTVSITGLQRITCLYCQRITKKSFNQGYCYPCFQRLARCDFCILKPEKCHYHFNTCREPAWGLSHCMQTHVIYLANTSGLKVGITRANHIPTRWIDQGAIQAIPFFSVDTRYASGLIEDKMRTFVSDKTQWQRMLSVKNPAIDLVSERERLYPLVLETIIPLNPIYLNDTTPIDLKYPILSMPEKIRSASLDKILTVEGRLVGIKGQYLIFDTGQVMNIRALGGYHAEVRIG
jgi:hypothetical protein